MLQYDERDYWVVKKEKGETIWGFIFCLRPCTDGFEPSSSIIFRSPVDSNKDF